MSDNDEAAIPILDREAVAAARRARRANSVLVGRTRVPMPRCVHCGLRATDPKQVDQ